METKKTIIDYQIDSAICRASYYEFVMEAWNVIEPYKPLQGNWHIKKIADKLQEAVERWERGEPAKNLVINVPPGTTKSTLVTKLLPAWIWARVASAKIIIATWESSLAINHGLKARDVVTSEWYQKCFGRSFSLKIDKNVKTEYDNNKGGSVITTSVGGSITGKHGDFVIIDDPNNPVGSIGRKDLEDVNNWHDQVLSTRMTDKKTSIKILVMQRIGQNDLSEYVLGKEGEVWEHICLPAEIADNVKPESWKKYYINGLLDPVRLDEESLVRLRTNLGANGYAGQVQQQPAPPEGNIIKREWLGTITLGKFESYRTTEPIIFFIDTAYTEKTTNDPSGIIATCMIGKTLYITHSSKVRMGFPELCRFVPSYTMSHGYTMQSTVRIEPKASGISLVQQLKESTGLNILRTPSPTDSKETRLNSIAPTVEAGRVVLIEGGWNKEFIEEVCGFPNMKNDEFVDLIVYAVNYHIKPVIGNLKGIGSKLG